MCRPRGLCLAALDPDWDCPWPLDWQRRYHHLAQLAENEPSGHLPHIAPGVLMDGDDFGRWFQRQRRDWRLLSSKQQKQLSKLGVQPAQARPPTPTVKGAAKGPSKAQQAFQRGLAALAQWIEREGAHRPVPRGHGEQITVDGEAEPALVKLGVWVSSTRCRRDKLTSEQLQALRGLGVEWA
ncbi:helicase associated domain-containing protein [Streptomyces flaveolus]|uniref:helicase associated domain-containing protein n=1 Tax=Streptomyces flaveolus TaxID=67297 RepID=UPI003F4DAC34